MEQNRDNWKASFAQMAQTLERMDKKLDKIDEINTKMDAILADLKIRPCDYNRR